MVLIENVHENNRIPLLHNDDEPASQPASQSASLHCARQGRTLRQDRACLASQSEGLNSLSRPQWHIVTSSLKGVQ